MANSRRHDGPFGYCLNTSTIMGQRLGVADEFTLAAEAGYDGIEPWVRELDAYAGEGGSLEDLGGKARDLGLAVVNLIGFFDWLADDDEQRRDALEQARHAMDVAARIGCPMLATPPMGVTEPESFDYGKAAERYADVCRVAEDYGVTPVLEFWGHSAVLGTLGEALHVAAGSGRREACVLADVFHMYKGGSPYEGLRLLGPNALGLFHMNDFPAEPPREEITDAERVYPGDGVAPLASIFEDLCEAGFRGMLSLELFNEQYWKEDARAVARTGLEKMQGLVQDALPDAS